MNTTIQTSLSEEKFSKRVKAAPASFLREILKFTTQPGIISFAGGLPNPKLFPTDQLRIAANVALSDGGQNTLQYSITEGYLPLRELISQRYWEKHQLKIPPEEILITNGSQQGLDLLGKVLIDEGDTILLEKPSYLGAIQAFSFYRPRFQSIKLLNDGPDLTELRHALSSDSIKLMYSVSNFQNPTGIQWSESKRQLIGEELAQRGIFTIDDNPYGEINFTKQHAPLIKAFAKDWGILLGSFSKIISPGLRIGWIAAHKKIIDKLVIAKQASDLHSNLLSQKMIYTFMKEEFLDEHIKKLTLAYKMQKDIMIEEMNNEFPKEAKFADPSGGMFVWVTLPENVDTFELFKKAINEKIAFVPGKTFYPGNEENNTMRLNFTNSSREEIKEGIKRLGKIIKVNLK